MRPSMWWSSRRTRSSAIETHPAWSFTRHCARARSSMARKRLPPHDPREWLNRARSNLIRAQHVRPDVYLEDLCFDAQQAAEKAIKSVFIHRGQSFPYIHDLANLLKRL